MIDHNFSTFFLVDQTPEEAFNAINNVSGWWTENLEGGTLKQDDEFDVHFGEVHYSRQKLTEVVPGKKMVWLVTDSKLNFLKHKREWTGTKIRFDISKQGNKTRVRFTHEGLVREIECFNDCSNAWSGYINDSLYKLITTGKGQPTPKETRAEAVKG
jgi:hypothetical protein